jgi:PEP-CTERM motif
VIDLYDIYHLARGLLIDRQQAILGKPDQDREQDLMKYNLLGAASTIALGAVIGLGTTGAAFAGPTPNPVVISDPFSIGPTLSGNTTLTFTGGAAAIPAGQVLESVTVTFKVNEFTLNGTYGLISGVSGTASGLIANGGVSIKYPNAFGITIAGDSLSTSPPFSNAALTGSGKQVYSTASLQNATSASQTFTGNGAVSAFNSLSNLSILVHASNSQGGTVSSNILTGVSGSITGSVTLAYTYGSPTPEPATLAVLGTGILGLGAMRRRRKV